MLKAQWHWAQATAGSCCGGMLISVALLTSAAVLLHVLAFSLLLAPKGERAWKSSAELHVPHPSPTVSMPTGRAAIPRAWLQINPKLRGNCYAEAK